MAKQKNIAFFGRIGTKAREHLRNVGVPSKAPTGSQATSTNRIGATLQAGLPINTKLAVPIRGPAIHTPAPRPPGNPTG